MQMTVRRNIEHDEIQRYGWIGIAITEKNIS